MFTVRFLDDEGRVIANLFNLSEGQIMRVPLDHMMRELMKVPRAIVVLVQRPVLVPHESAEWPWPLCPDCHRPPGHPHTDLCGSHDRPPV